MDIKVVSRQGSMVMHRWSFTRMAYEAHDVIFEQCKAKGYIVDLEALGDFPGRPDWSRLKVARRIFDRSVSAYHASLLDED